MSSVVTLKNLGSISTYIRDGTDLGNGMDNSYYVVQDLLGLLIIF